MYILIQLLLFILPIALQSEELFIPSHFENGEIIEQVILISDVDGVIRDSIEATADPRIIAAIKELLKNKNVDVTFISGTPVANDSSTEIWRRGNISLTKVFGDSFTQELLDKRVSIYGVLGGQRMNEYGEVEVLDEYSPELKFEIARLVLQAFLIEVIENGTLEQKQLAQNLQEQLKVLHLKNPNQPSAITPEEFSEIVLMVREHFDPEFRMICNGALIETHTSNPPWQSTFSSNWLINEIEKPHYLSSSLTPEQRRIATGYAKRGENGINYLLVSKTNKGIAIKRHIEEKLKTFPNALIITIGDTQVDFPMHQHAHLSFHVGKEQVWINNYLPHCMMVRDSHGNDSQHVSGTLHILKTIHEGIGKAFHELNYVPVSNSTKVH